MSRGKNDLVKKAAEFTQPSFGEANLVSDLTPQLPLHQFSRPLVAARARLDGFKEYYDAQSEVSVELDSTSAKMHIYDKKGLSVLAVLN